MQRCRHGKKGNRKMYFFERQQVNGDDIGSGIHMHSMRFFHKGSE